MCRLPCCRVCEFLSTGIEVLQNLLKFWVRYGSLTELTEVPGTGIESYRSHRNSGYGYDCPTELTEVPGTRNTRENTPGMVLHVPYRQQQPALLLQRELWVKLAHAMKI